jgi:phospholipase A-2-activating protein
MDPEESAFDDVPMAQDEEEKIDYESNDYKFMQTLQVHSGSVKSVATNEKGLMLSGSVDNSCKLFTIDETTGKYEFLQELAHHDHYVYTVAERLNGQGFLTSGKDARIFMLDNSGNPEKMLEGHSALVNMVCQVDENTILSGSWDGTAKIWDIASGT